MSTLMLVSRRAAEDGRHARPIRDADQRDLGLVTAVRDTAYDLLFHDLFLIHYKRAGAVRGWRTWMHPARMASATERVSRTLAPCDAISSISS